MTKKRNRRKKEIVAVCGLGYVGFPVSLMIADAGFTVIGIDTDDKRISQINKGTNVIQGKEPGLAELQKKLHKKGNLRASIDISEYKNADYIIVAVQTPVGEKDKRPTYKNLKAALRGIAKSMSPNVTVIIESTIAPGTTESVVKPILERESGMKAGKDFHLVHCPERLMPGHLLENIREYNRVIGGYTDACAKSAKKLYRNFVEGKLDLTDCTTAEVVKTGENTYRDVQIAFANEMALICEKHGANVWEVRELINDCRKITETRPEALRQMHFPGAGVGGHCIPKDPWLLITGIKDEMKTNLIPTARFINDFMPSHMWELLTTALDEAGKKRADVTVTILGFAYDANSDDTRNTPAQPLLDLLKKNDIAFKVHDAYVKDYQDNLASLVKGADAVVLVTAHDEYRDFELSKLKKLMTHNNPIIIDGRNVFSAREALQLGFIYKGVGNTPRSS